MLLRELRSARCNPGGMRFALVGFPLRLGTWALRWRRSRWARCSLRFFGVWIYRRLMLCAGCIGIGCGGRLRGGGGFAICGGARRDVSGGGNCRLGRRKIATRGSNLRFWAWAATFHALARPCQDVFSARLARRRCRWLRVGRHGCRMLCRTRRRLPGGCRGTRRDFAQRADGRLERQALGLEETCAHAAPVADQGGKDNGAIDAGALALLCSECGVLEDLRQAGRDGGAARCAGRNLVIERADVSGDVPAQARQIDLAGFQHGGGVGVLAQGEQQMLEQNLSLGLAGSVLPCPEQCRLETRGHWDSAAILCHRLRHPLGVPLCAASCPTGLVKLASRRNFSRLAVSLHVCGGRATARTCRQPVDIGFRTASQSVRKPVHGRSRFRIGGLK